MHDEFVRELEEKLGGYRVSVPSGYDEEDDDVKLEQTLPPDPVRCHLRRYVGTASSKSLCKRAYTLTITRCPRRE